LHGSPKTLSQEKKLEMRRTTLVDLLRHPGGHRLGLGRFQCCQEWLPVRKPLLRGQTTIGEKIARLY
jgi:hypothetical protein